jgi:hypothetical protein
MRLWFTLALLLLLTSCTAQSGPGTATPPPQPTRPVEPGQQLTDRVSPDIPEVRERRAQIAAALAAWPPVLTRELADPDAQQAQALAIADEQVQQTFSFGEDDKPLLSEVFGVVPATAADIPDAGACRECWLVVLYNFGTNGTTRVLVDLAAEQVVHQTTLAVSQPEVPPHLARLAVAIARATPELQQELMWLPDEDMAIMEATKTSVQGTACERSRHLCVAPTFRWPHMALWAVIDLTELAPVALIWTNTGDPPSQALSETEVQNVVISDLCETPETLERGPWSLDSIITSSDGIAFRNLRYNGDLVIESLKIVDWHVRYEPVTPDSPPVGYSDAIGCPTFSSAAVVPFSLPVVEDLAENGGVVITQDFRSPLWPQACNYRYQTRLTLHDDGRIGFEAVNIGGGCGDEGTYRPILRVALAGETTEFTDPAGDEWETEQWTALQPGEGSRFRLATSAADWQIAPMWGEAYEAFLYASVAHAGEGATDLPSIGTCCNEDWQQGPEQFLTPAESLTGSPTVLWFVPAIANAERAQCWAEVVPQGGVLIAEEWPCSSGLMLAPRTE